MRSYKTDISGALFKFALAKEAADGWSWKTLKEMKDVLINKLQERPRCPERHTYAEYGQPSYREDWSNHISKFKEKDEFGYEILNTVKNPIDGHPYNIYLVRKKVAGRGVLHDVPQIIKEVETKFGKSKLSVSLNTWTKHLGLH